MDSVETELINQDMSAMNSHSGGYKSNAIVSFLASATNYQHLSKAKKIVNGGSGVRAIDGWRKLLGLFALMFLTLLFSMVFVIYSELTIYIYEMFLIIGFLAVLVGLVTILKRMIFFGEVKDFFLKYIKITHNVEDEDTINKLVDELLGYYHAPLTNRIMSLGVIPIILGIIALILTDLNNDEPEAFGRVNVVYALLLLGGTTEGLAFLFGFLYPDSTSRSHPSKLLGVMNKGQMHPGPNSVSNNPETPKSDLSSDNLHEALTEIINKTKVTTSFRVEP